MSNNFNQKHLNRAQTLTVNLKRLAKNDYENVHKAALDMIRCDVNDPVPYTLLGVIASDHNNHVKACELFERAAVLAPDQAIFQAYHAQALTILGQQNRAKNVADIAAALPINEAHTADTIGVVYSRTGFHELAIPLFERAVELNKKPANYHYNLGASRQFLGRFEQAECAFNDTIERDPTHYKAWSARVMLKKQTEVENEVGLLIDQFNKFEDHANARLHFGHAIAKTLEDLGDYEASFDWLVKAKAYKRASLVSESFDYSELFEAAKTTVSHSESDSKTGSVAPIFVFGLPRTGTTLVDRILSSHPDVIAAGELNMFAGLIKEAVGSPSNLVMDAETLKMANDVDLRVIGKKYIEQTKNLARNAPRMTDKMPLNFFYAGLIHRAFPNARMVVLRRGAMDSCLSNFRQLFTVQYSYYNYTYDLEDTARYYRNFEDLITFWRKNLPSENFMEIHYEHIVHDQERQTANLLSFCDLDWNDACLRFHENQAAVSTASSVQVRQPLYSGSIGRWKKYGNKLDPLKTALGSLVDHV